MSLEWLSLIGAIWLQSMSGTNSNFPAYSSHLKHLLKLSQLQLNNLALASDTGKLFGWISGFAAAYLPLWLVLLIGATLGFIGYGVQYLFVTNQISSLSYLQAFMLTFLAGNSICWINTVCYIIAIQNFPYDRQIAVGLSTSYQGLSAKIFTDIVNSINQSNGKKRAKTYLLLNATLPLLVCIGSGPIVRNVNIGKTKKLAHGFLIMFTITIFTGIYAVTSSISFVTRILSPYILVSGIGFFLLLPFMVPLVEKLCENRHKKCMIRETKVWSLSTPSTEDNIDTNSVEEEEEDGEKSSSSSSVHKGIYVCREEIGPKLMLKRVEFWLYYFVYLFGVTLGLVYMNNLGQIVESRGSSKTSAFLALSSSFGFFGRLVPSVLDYYFSRYNYIVSRPASIAAMMIPMSCAFFLLINGSNLVLYISTAIIGICTGAITAITVSTTTELFGVTSFGINHNILVTNIPLGSFVFGDLAALIYKKYMDDENGGICMGSQCYQTSFLLWGSLCVFGTFLALLLHFKTKDFYSQIRSI